MSSNSYEGEKVVINLERGKTGLGFNIKGGNDMQLMPGDDGIYIAKIKDDGAAALDGRLKVGDKIISVNGNSLIGVKHDFAVQTFVKAGASVTIEVIPGAEQKARKRLNNRDGAGSSRLLTVGAVAAALGVVAVVGITLYRYKCFSVNEQAPREERAD